jgi:hypothetical protein
MVLGPKENFHPKLLPNKTISPLDLVARPEAKIHLEVPGRAAIILLPTISPGTVKTTGVTKRNADEKTCKYRHRCTQMQMPSKHTPL